MNRPVHDIFRRSGVTARGSVEKIIESYYSVAGARFATCHPLQGLGEHRFSDEDNVEFFDPLDGVR